MPISGMRISAAREDTTLPTAPPTMTATAKRQHVVLQQEFFEAFDHSGLLRLNVRTQKLRQPLHSRLQDTALRRVANAERALAAGAERHTGRQAYPRLLQ